MKRVIVALIIVFLAGIAVAPTAFAVDIPYVVIGENVWLLDVESGSRLFLLPETYYAKISDLDENFYYVTFNGVSGKIEKSLVSSIGYHTEAPGSMQEIKIDSKYAIFTEIKLKSTMDGNSEDIPVPVDGSFIFLGKYPLTEMWYYIRYNEICGYVKADFTTNPDLTIPNFVPEEKPAEPTETPAEETTEVPPEESNLIKILVITGLGVALIVLLVIIFRPRKKGVNKYYYEDNGEL